MRIQLKRIAFSMVATSGILGLSMPAAVPFSCGSLLASEPVSDAVDWRSEETWKSRVPGAVLKFNAKRQITAVDLSKCEPNWQEIGPAFAAIETLDTVAANHPDTPPEALVALGQASKLKVLRASGKGIDDSSISKLAPLKNVAVLSLTDTSVGDAGLKSLAHWTTLKELSLVGNPVSDSVLEVFAQSPSLTKLRIRNTELFRGDRLGEQLKSFPNLVALELSEVPLEDEALLGIAKLPKVADLNLLRTKVTIAGLESLRGLPLKRLNLDDIRGVDDSVFTVLETLEQLEWLHLGKTAITDNGFHRLAKLKNLGEVKINGTGISDEAIKRLLESNPGLKCSSASN